MLATISLIPSPLMSTASGLNGGISVNPETREVRVCCAWEPALEEAVTPEEAMGGKDAAGMVVNLWREWFSPVLSKTSIAEQLPLQPTKETSRSVAPS